jgi:photosystem II stability/assembly factor-like uncharacterized protein
MYVQCLDTRTCVAVGDQGALLRTDDGGTGWLQRPGCGGQNLNAVHFPVPDIGYVAGTGGRVCKSDDGGKTWYPRQSGTGKELRALRFLDASRGYAVGEEGVILSTGNGGETWENLAGVTVIGLQSVFPTEAAVHVIGEGGVILRSEGSLAAAAGPRSRGTKARPEFRIAPARFRHYDAGGGSWRDILGKSLPGRKRIIP